MGYTAGLLTRRLGLIAEGAYVDTPGSGGAGDSFVALRAMLLEQERFLFSVSGEARLPTGSESKGTGTGEWGWAAIAHGWLDLGDWFVLQGTVGYEAVPAIDESVTIWSAAFSKSFPVAPLFGGRRDEHGQSDRLNGDGVIVGVHADRTPGFEPRRLWEVEHIRPLPQRTRLDAFGADAMPRAGLDCCVPGRRRSPSWRRVPCGLLCRSRLRPLGAARELRGGGDH